MPQFDFLIVGAGPFGSTFARQASDRGKSCLVIDRRPHIAGNTYDELIQGINVHRYGPHIFHTNDEEVWRFVNQFSRFLQYEHRVKGCKDGLVFPVPINLMTMYLVWGVTTPAEAEARLQQSRIPCENAQNLEQWVLHHVGRELYELVVKGYTEKQWGRPCSELPPRIIQRLPIRMNWDDRYHSDRYSGLPEAGYTGLIRNLLDGIRVELEVDYFHDRDHWDALADTVVYTGPVDRYFDHCHGELQYRSLRFETEQHRGDLQGCPQLNFTCRDVPHTRILEWKHFQRLTCDHSVITREFPHEWAPGSEPYYPISDERNTTVYEKYAQLARQLGRKVIIGGRLGTYKYLDMDQTIGQSLRFAARVLS